jgi:hypothetical protein
MPQVLHGGAGGYWSIENFWVPHLPNTKAARTAGCLACPGANAYIPLSTRRVAGCAPVELIEAKVLYY